MIEPLADRALLALQGPKAASVLGKFSAGVSRDEVHGCRPAQDRRPMTVSCRARATPARTALRFRCRRSRPSSWRDCCLTDEDVLPIGLGARDSLRLEAGLCLCGHDIDSVDHAGRGRAGMVDTKEPPQRRRARRRLCRRGQDSRPARIGRALSPRRPEGGGTRAGARGRAAVCGRRLHDAGRQGHLGRIRPEPECAGRDGLSADRARPASARRCSPKCAASACRCRSRPRPSFPTPTNAEGST